MYLVKGVRQALAAGHDAEIIVAEFVGKYDQATGVTPNEDDVRAVIRMVS